MYRHLPSWKNSAWSCTCLDRKILFWRRVLFTLSESMSIVRDENVSAAALALLFRTMPGAPTRDRIIHI